MTPTAVTVTRIMLRNRGSISQLSIEGELTLTPVDPDDDLMTQHVAEVIKVSELPTVVQQVIQSLLTRSQTRLERKYKVVSS